MPKLRRCAGVARIERPSRRMSPALGASNPASIIRVVVLPDPEGARSVRNSPRRTSRSRSRTANDVPSIGLRDAGKADQGGRRIGDHAQSGRWGTPDVSTGIRGATFRRTRREPARGMRIETGTPRRLADEVPGRRDRAAHRVRHLGAARAGDGGSLRHCPGSRPISSATSRCRPRGRAHFSPRPTGISTAYACGTGASTPPAPRTPARRRQREAGSGTLSR